MRLPTSTDLYTWAWRVAPRLPEWPVQAVGALAADATWLLHTDGVKQLERNLARIRPGLSARELRRLSRTGMRSYMRYFVEAFQIAGFSRRRCSHGCAPRECRRSPRSSRGATRS